MERDTSYTNNRRSESRSLSTDTQLESWPALPVPELSLLQVPAIAERIKHNELKAQRPDQQMPDKFADLESQIATTSKPISQILCSTKDISHSFRAGVLMNDGRPISMQLSRGDKKSFAPSQSKLKTERVLTGAFYSALNVLRSKTGQIILRELKRAALPVSLTITSYLLIKTGIDVAPKLIQTRIIAGLFGSLLGIGAIASWFRYGDSFGYNKLR